MTFPNVLDHIVFVTSYVSSDYHVLTIKQELQMMAAHETLSGKGYTQESVLPSLLIGVEYKERFSPLCHISENLKE